MTNTEPSDLARLIQAALAGIGSDADAIKIADEVHRLDIGLPLEDEFSVLCGWLGNCSLLHKLDQEQVPAARSRKQFQVPDLLAFFDSQTQNSPLLIEVKSRRKPKLSFRADYLERLTNYATLLNMPLLIAWKFHGLWLLFEPRHMKLAKTNFHISIETAARENLMGVLAGDVAYKFGTGVKLRVKLRKVHLANEERSENKTTQTWNMVIEESVFTDYDGNSMSNLDSGAWQLFINSDLAYDEQHSASHIELSWEAGAEGIVFAQTALPRLLEWESPSGTKINWRHLLQKEDPTAITDLQTVLDCARQQKVVSHVFHWRPHSLPAFLERPLDAPDHGVSTSE